MPSRTSLSSLSELGDLLRDFLANLEGESASELRELARLSRAGHRSGHLARTGPDIPAPRPWFGDD